VLTTSNRRVTLLRNDGGKHRRSLDHPATPGVRCNRDGIGARVTVRAAGRTQVQEVRKRLLLPVAERHAPACRSRRRRASRLDSRSLAREGEEVEKIGPVAADQFLVIREGSGLVASSGPGTVPR